MTRIALYLLGPPRIERQGQPVPLDTRKAVALAAYLALEGQAKRRETLQALLWPEYPSTRAAASLRRTLSVLNKGLGGEGLNIEREQVWLEAGAEVWVDVQAFRAALAECARHGHDARQTCPDCLEPLREAAALYRDDFMAGFALRDSMAFDDWQFFQREGLRRELAGALERLIGLLSERRELEAAIGHARRWLALDPWQEPAHSRLMLLYAWSGQRAAALRQYEECRRVLQRELAVEPLEETTALYEAIRRNQPPPPPAAGGAAPAEARPRREAAPALPLAGRAPEQAALRAALEGARLGGRLVVLEGEAGIGKTRLAEALLAEARRRGAAVLTGRGYEGEARLAYAPILALLRDAAQAPWAASWTRGLTPETLEETARLLPGLGGARPTGAGLPPLESPGAQTRFFEALTQALHAALAAGAATDEAPPGVVFLDDLHWADESTLDLLSYLLRRSLDRPLAVLAAWRGDLVPPSHRLRALLAEATRRGVGQLITLPRLGPEAVDELLHAALGAAAVPQALAERLYRESEGLPFAVVEYLEALQRSAGGGESADWSLPEGLRALLGARLRGLSESAQQLLGAAAVLGGPFDADTLQAAAGRSAEETLQGLERAAARGLVRELEGSGDGGAPQYDFSHEKLRALALEGLSAARRRLLHGRAAEALVRQARGRLASGPRAAAVAEHFRLAGRPAEAARYFQQAGEHARALYANAEAIGHFEAALALGHPDTASLHEALGDLHTLAGDYAAALAAYREARKLAPVEAAAGLEHKRGLVCHRRGEWEQAAAHFAAALQADPAPGQEGARARVLADWSQTARQMGAVERAEELAGQALALAEVAGDRRALASCHNLLGMLAGGRGDLGAARQHLEHSLRLAEALGDAEAQAAALNNLARALAGAGELELARTLTERALAICAAVGDRHRMAALYNNLADLLHDAGETEQAMARLKQAVAIYAEIGQAEGAWQPEIWMLAAW